MERTVVTHPPCVKYVLPCTQAVEHIHDPRTSEEVDPDLGFHFIRTTCRDCGKWMGDNVLPS